MKNLLFVFLILLFALSCKQSPGASATEEEPLVRNQYGYISLRNSPGGNTTVYDSVVVKLKDAGVWDMKWTMHALGAMQDSGLIGLIVFPDTASMNSRNAAANQVFETNNLVIPSPSNYEIYNMNMNTIPTPLPGDAVLVYHAEKGMTTDQYESILKELGTAFGKSNPAQLAHVCYSTPDGLQVVDIWDSPASFDAFGKILVPILTKTYGREPSQPMVYKLYNLVH